VSETLRYVLSFGVSLAAALVLTPLAAKAAHRVGALDTPEGHKTHTAITPYLGGVAVMVALIAVGAIAGAMSPDGQLLTIVAGAIVLTTVGLIDDLGGGLSPVIRVGLEAAAGLALWLVGVQAGVFAIDGLDMVLTVVWVVAVVNAFNMTDNMDGLAGGVAAASALGIAIVTALQGDYLMASFAFAVVGASLGFLRYNFPPARIFLGDAGSMLLGFLVAALTLHLDLAASYDWTRLTVIALLAFVPMTDLTVVVVARLLGRRPVWLGGTDHTSHRLAHRGLSRRGVALLIPGLQLACSALAVAVAVVDTPAFTNAVMIGGVAVWAAALVVLVRLPHPIVLERETGPAEAEPVVVLPVSEDRSLRP
jgi:UDP-GlcNAc:undecaprenyl-phosphate GlcNAc-1-phosphate transferase